MALATFGGLQFLGGAESTTGGGGVQSKGSASFGQKVLGHGRQSSTVGNVTRFQRPRQQAYVASAAVLDVDSRAFTAGRNAWRSQIPESLPVCVGWVQQVIIRKLHRGWLGPAGGRL